MMETFLRMTISFSMSNISGHSDSTSLVSSSQSRNHLDFMWRVTTVMTMMAQRKVNISYCKVNKIANKKLHQNQENKN